MWTILPIKALRPVKSRLASVLTPGQRVDFMRAMLEDVLGALQVCEYIEGVLLVSRDPGITDLAHSYGAQVLAPAQDENLNSAVQAAVDHLCDKGLARALILHGDIPLIRAADLSRLIEQSVDSNLSLLACRHGQGTNALITSLPAVIPFMYGNDSYQEHHQLARDRDLLVQTLNVPAITLDIDTADDMLALSGYYRDHAGHRQSRSYQFMAKLGLLQDTKQVLEQAMSGNSLSKSQARALALVSDTKRLVSVASSLTNREHGRLVSYSRKVFIPLTQLCRDVCHYCTFAKTPGRLGKPYMSVEEVLEVARQGASLGCKEALLTLGEKPELRYSAARKALRELGFESTLEYVAHVAQAIFEETGLLPHVNAGCMNADELIFLKEFSASMGIMLESSAKRLCEKGMPHYGSPDKLPDLRLETIALAGQAKVPFTTGILIGIGETRLERIESLLVLRELHHKYGHIQEVIIQNFRAKPDTPMANSPEPDQNELCWTIAVARIIFGARMNIQAPPNLAPESLGAVIDAGINDLGGISPLTPDFVNPEAPWPHLDTLAQQLDGMGRYLQQRLTVYPSFVREAGSWVSKSVLPQVLRLADGQGFAREDDWLSGISTAIPKELGDRISNPKMFGRRISTTTALLQRLQNDGAESLGSMDIGHLFTARGDDFTAVCRAADQLRLKVNGNVVSFVSNRNINYTNICYFKCKFCAYSKGKVTDDLREKPYNLGLAEIQERTLEAHALGATEVCLQGGIHPDYTGQHYIDICHTIKKAVPGMHIHAFSPLEIWQGAETLGISLAEFLRQLQSAGLGSLPGTAAEILQDDVRRTLCADKLNTNQWLEVMETAHGVGLNSTATIMFGHVDHYVHWAQHLLSIRGLQRRSGGFTEFVPLPFVAEMAPIYRRGQSRRGPTFREAVLMHAVARLVLHPHINNIQSSWVKMGRKGMQACLHAGVNDMGGTLINESITRSAGASHGQAVDLEFMRNAAADAGRALWQRTTLYGKISKDRVSAKLLTQPR